MLRNDFQVNTAPTLPKVQGELHIPRITNRASTHLKIKAQPQVVTKACLLATELLTSSTIWPEETPNLRSHFSYQNTDGYFASAIFQRNLSLRTYIALLETAGEPRNTSSSPKLCS